MIKPFPPHLKDRLSAGERLLGCFASIPHPMAIEICAAQGFDTLCIDTEHSQIGRERLEELIRACDGCAIPAMVRVPGDHQAWIAAALDAGADALMVPRISTADAARRVVRSALYPPRGERGLGPGRSSGYGYKIVSHIEHAARTLVAVQIETAQGLENVDEIAAVEGIDMVFVGPFDLEMSLRAGGVLAQGVLEAAISTIGDSALRHCKTAGIFTREFQDVKAWTDRGFTFFLVGSDSMFLGAGAAACVKGVRVLTSP